MHVSNPWIADYALAKVDHFITQALAEDLGEGDHTSLATIPADHQSTARLLVKQPGVLAGVAFAERLFARVSPLFQFEAYLNDGTVVELTDRVLVPVAFDVTGPTRLLLSTERLCLNVMQRMSGIATRTYEYQWLIAHTGCRVLDTRKTVPLNRHFDKWAVAIGGGKNHRIGLYDEVLIKDNHVDACGGIEAALTAVQVYFRKIGRRMPVVLEIRTLTELTQALAIGNFDRLLLDNFSVQGLAEALKMINRKYPTEASGNISRETIVSYAETGVDYISVGALTHSVQALDLSLKIATR